MRKRQLASQVSERFAEEYNAHISTNDVYNLLTVLASVVIENCAAGEEVRLAGLCKFVRFKWHGRIVQDITGQRRRVDTQHAIRARVFGGANRRLRSEMNSDLKRRNTEKRLKTFG